MARPTTARARTRTMSTPPMPSGQTVSISLTTSFLRALPGLRGKSWQEHVCRPRLLGGRHFNLQDIPHFGQVPAAVPGRSFQCFQPYKFSPRRNYRISQRKQSEQPPVRTGGRYIKPPPAAVRTETQFLKGAGASARPSETAEKLTGVLVMSACWKPKLAFCRCRLWGGLIESLRHDL